MLALTENSASYTPLLRGFPRPPPAPRPAPPPPSLCGLLLALLSGSMLSWSMLWPVALKESETEGEGVVTRPSLRSSSFTSLESLRGGPRA